MSNISSELKSRKLTALRVETIQEGPESIASANSGRVRVSDGRHFSYEGKV
jgi:hypothetical protein